MARNSIVALQLISEWSRLEGTRVGPLVRVIPKRSGRGRLLNHSYPSCAVFLVVTLVGAEPAVFYLDPRDMGTLWWFV
ncbi:hypothetical protein JCM24511_00724 [Saitozyma sp. JCM 24511]|nr:hypothetical protein JCM24511_00724 [Saitozyma sp. JCM 24511]